ncbi:MAG: toprim domain-containing protein [Kiloniellales bacterium]
MSMSAENLALTLNGRKSGASWMCLCPAHPDRSPSLAVRDAEGGAVLVRCHAGCSQEQVIAALRAKGLWPMKNGARSPWLIRRRPDRPEDKNKDRSASALRLWERTLPPRATVLEVYLHWRGITLNLPASLRFHTDLKHPSGGRWPGMVALVTNGVTGKPQAVHRSFLARDGRGKAPVDPQRMMLGPCAGGAVRLADPEKELLVGEGVETCLAAMQASGKPAWAAMSAPGLGSLELPPAIEKVIVLADGDLPGEAAARGCATRWRREGRHVRIARPPLGLDFADLLEGRER